MATNLNSNFPLNSQLKKMGFTIGKILIVLSLLSINLTVLAQERITFDLKTTCNYLHQENSNISNSILLYLTA